MQAPRLDSMKPVRPTIRLLRKLLKPEQFADPSILDNLASALALSGHARMNALAELNFLSIQHKLLTDANARFENGGMPDRHHESTKAYGSPVYEVRSRIGAGWRGAIILDDDGDPWLVYAAPHDEFHSKAPTALRREKSGSAKANVWEPTSIDLKMKEVEAERLDRTRTSERVYLQVIGGIRESKDTRAKVELISPAHWSANTKHSTVSYSVNIEHDEPAQNAESAHTTTSEIDIVIRLRNANQDIKDIVSAAACFLQPDETLRTAAYSNQDELVHSVMITHARLAQLLAEIDDPGSGFPGPPTPPTRRHWFTSGDQVSGFVEGNAVIALCGNAYILTKGEDADLPICGECEKVKPVAQDLLDQLRLLEQRAG